MLPHVEAPLDDHRDKGTSVAHAKDPSVTFPIYIKDRNVQGGFQQSELENSLSLSTFLLWVLLIPLVPSPFPPPTGCPLAVQGNWPHPSAWAIPPPPWDLRLTLSPTSPPPHVPGVCLSLLGGWLGWYLVEYLWIQKHSWCPIDSICFIRVVCASQNGTEFIYKGRMPGQVLGQWESSLRTKAGTCWCPFKSYGMLRPCVRSEEENLSESQLHLTEGVGNWLSNSM